MSDYYKYLKYKNKYLELKKQYGYGRPSKKPGAKKQGGVAKTNKLDLTTQLMELKLYEIWIKIFEDNIQDLQQFSFNSELNHKVKNINNIYSMNDIIFKNFYLFNKIDYKINEEDSRIYDPKNFEFEKNSDFYFKNKDLVIFIILRLWIIINSFNKKIDSFNQYIENLKRFNGYESLQLFINLSIRLLNANLDIFYNHYIEICNILKKNKRLLFLIQNFFYNKMEEYFFNTGGGGPHDGASGDSGGGGPHDGASGEGDEDELGPINYDFNSNIVTFLNFINIIMKLNTNYIFSQSDEFYHIKLFVLLNNVYPIIKIAPNWFEKINKLDTNLFKLKLKTFFEYSELMARIGISHINKEGDVFTNFEIKKYKKLPEGFDDLILKLSQNLDKVLDLYNIVNSEDLTFDTFREQVERGGLPFPDGLNESNFNSNLNELKQYLNYIFVNYHVLFLKVIKSQFIQNLNLFFNKFNEKYIEQNFNIKLALTFLESNKDKKLLEKYSNLNTYFLINHFCMNLIYFKYFLSSYNLNISPLIKNESSTIIEALFKLEESYKDDVLMQLIIKKYKNEVLVNYPELKQNIELNENFNKLLSFFNECNYYENLPRLRHQSLQLELDARKLAKIITDELILAETIARNKEEEKAKLREQARLDKLKKETLRKNKQRLEKKAKEEAEMLRRERERLEDSGELSDQQRARLIEIERQRKADVAQQEKAEREAERKAAQFNVELPESENFSEYLFTYNDFNYEGYEKYNYIGKQLVNIGEIGNGDTPLILKIKFSKDINTVNTDRQPRKGIIIEIAKNWHLTILYKDAVGNYLFKPHLTNDFDPRDHKHYFFYDNFDNNGIFKTPSVPKAEDLRIFSLLLVSKLAQNLKSDVVWISNMLNQLSKI